MQIVEYYDIDVILPEVYKHPVPIIVLDRLQPWKVNMFPWMVWNFKASSTHQQLSVVNPTNGGMVSFPQLEGSSSATQ